MKTKGKTKARLAEEIKCLNGQLEEMQKMRGYDVQQQLNIVYDALDSTINGVIITDISGKIIYANPAFISMFEYESKSDITGRHAADIFAARGINKFSDIQNIIDKGKGNTQEFGVYRGDGSIFPVEAATSIVKDAGGHIIGRMVSFIDITERKKAEEVNRKLSSELLKSQEKERQRVARDLHDGVGQTILAAKLFFKAFQKDTGSSDKFVAGITFIDRASEELREIYNDLYPAILRDYGLEKTIKWYAKNYLELNNIKTDIVINLQQKLPADVEENLYRIIKELFSNIIKHSHADSVKVHFAGRNNVVLLNVSDNGTGFDTAHPAGHGCYGLSNIMQRVNELGGMLSIISNTENGTSVKVEIYLQ